MAAFGPVLGVVDYETFVGLWLNLDRVHGRTSWDTKSGIELAISNDPIDRLYVDAICQFPEQVYLRRVDLNEDRRINKLMSGQP